jgi:glycerol-3-phosphate acyltransferase PlsY
MVGNAVFYFIFHAPVVFLLAYLLGSIPFGFLLTRAAGLGDIRAIGSGNIGATNVLRTGNKKLAAATLALDAAKGAIAVLLASFFAPHFEEIAALGALTGHLFPVWLKFKGGKGVATGMGVMTALSWPVGVLMMITWLLVAKRFKISSLAALVAFGFIPVEVMLFERTDLVPLALTVTALIFFQHRDNIRRLFHRNEPKIGSQNATTPAERN